MATNKTTLNLNLISIKDSADWLKTNMFIDSQMIVSTDMEKNVTVEAWNYLPYEG